MIGEKKILARNKNNSYEFTLRRNITVLRGDSGRGKTKLFELVYDNNRFGKGSDAKISCDCPVIAYNGANWERDISEIDNSIIIIDEENSRFINSVDFARTIRGTSNYYLLITRNYLPQLPYSVDEIYEISGRGKNKKFVKSYSSSEYMYVAEKLSLPFAPDVIITEDSKSGYEFWSEIAKDKNIPCFSAKSKTEINRVISKYGKEKLLIIADGAAFGPEIDRIAIKQANSSKKIAMCLPESFEWLILASGILEQRGIKLAVASEQIKNLDVEIDSEQYFSWERYFTELLENATKDSRFGKYTKNNIANFYIEDVAKSAILNLLGGLG